MATHDCNLLIIGGGPGGLSAAINGSSEGMATMLIDSGPELGGQAVGSSSIENYSGFPEGISGKDLLGRFIRQASKFRTDILCPQTAVALRQDGNRRIITTDDEETYVANIVILGIGLSYRRLGAPGIGSLMGRGVLYGSPTVDPLSLGECVISVVGGANSAGQAALNLAHNKKAKIKILARKKIESQMSQYLVDRVRATENIEVLEGVEVLEARGSDKLESIVLKRVDATEEMQTNHLFIFIGAAPKTLWLRDDIGMDDHHFVLTGPKLVTADKWRENRPPLPFETTMPGVFACGDVRVGSIKRVSAAVGEGTAALAMCHEFLRLTNGA